MSACHRCGIPNDKATPSEDNMAVMPTAGDAAMCFYCGEVAVFTGNGIETRVATPAERTEMLTWPEVVDALFAWRQYREQRGGGPTTT